MIILVLEFVIHIFIYLISFPSYHNLDIWQWAIYMVSNYFDKFIETGANESTCPSNCHPDSSEHFVGNGKSSKTFLKLNQPSSAPELSIWIGIITCTPTYARNRGTVSTPSFPLAHVPSCWQCSVDFLAQCWEGALISISLPQCLFSFCLLSTGRSDLLTGIHPSDLSPLSSALISEVPTLKHNLALCGSHAENPPMAPLCPA